MTPTLEQLAGTAAPATLYGIGVGPGDVRYLTLRAAGLIGSVDVLASFAKHGHDSHARAIAKPLIAEGRTELRLGYPVTVEIPVADARYARQIGAFYQEAAAAIANLLKQGKSVGVLSEGDPFFYGSFMHLWRRLSADFSVEVVPGVTGMSGAWTGAGTPITWGDDILTVLPATLDEAVLAQRLAKTDAAVILKLGRHLAKVRRAVTVAGCLDRAVYVERAAMPEQRIMPLADCDLEAGPYFSMVLVPGQGRRA